MQEKADLICGNYRQVKGVYSYCYDDIEMQDYIEAVFSQMLEFITKTGFSDVKYDNIPLTHDGHVALIDLDRSSLIGGLTKGGAKGNNGLFNYIPAKYIDYFQSLTKDTLNLEDEALLNNCIEVIKKRNLEKISKKAAYEQFCQNNRISFACQTINQDFKKICADKKKQDFAKIIIAELNKSLANSKNFSPRVGRTVTLDLNVNNSLFKTAAKIWKQIIYRTNKPSNEVVFLNLVPEILDDLKKSGYIHSYKICGRYSKVKIVC